MHQFLFCNEFIIHLYMFRAQLRSLSGGRNCIAQHLPTSQSAGGVRCTPVHAILRCTVKNTSKLKIYLFLNINQLDALNFITSLFQASTCFEHMCSSSGGQQLYYPDDEHMCSKHLEAWNKLIIKFGASSWLILRNKYIEMHGQQNIKKIKNICFVDF